MRILSVVLVLMFAFSVPSMAQESTLPAPAVTLEVVEITGVYSCTGTTKDGQAYEQFAQINRIGDVFLVIWSDGKGNVSAQGIGFIDGDVFVVGIDNPKSVGGAVYRYDSEKSLWTGTWVNSNDSGKYPEILKKIADLPSPTSPSEPAAPVKKAPLATGPGIKVA